MKDLTAFPSKLLAGINAVFTDIDDTLTTDGMLPADAYTALEQLSRAGIDVVPITGRPAGWCDMIARFWPVAGIVGENGAFYFSYQRQTKKMQQFFVAGVAEREANREKLDRLKERILNEVTGSALASDQFCRVADLAIDICEDVDPLSADEVAQILKMFSDAGATAKLSSVHVNGWYGEYDKLSTSRIFARDILGVDLDADKDRVVFVGDSPNDSPMFSFFPHSCGVANVRDFKESELEQPTYVTRQRGGAGFVEVAELLLASR
jgi:HAD superfamily hydrolase (TIGR01484 family)